MKRLRSLLVLLAVLPALVWAAPREAPQRPDPAKAPQYPSYVETVRRAVVGARGRVLPARASAPIPGTERRGSGVIFDPAGFALTVSSVLLDAEGIEVSLGDGRRLPARLVELHLEAGLGVLKIDGPGPFPAAALGDSTTVTVGQPTATVGLDDDGALSATVGSVREIRAFTGYWEYLLDRAFMVAPYSLAFGGSALVNHRGEVIGIVSLRLGPPPFANLAIPGEKFLTMVLRPADRYQFFRTTGR